MKRLKRLKLIVSLPIALAAGQTALAPAVAGPFSGGVDRPATARPDVVQAGHRHHGPRAHRHGRHHRVVLVPAHRRDRDLYVVRRHGHRYHGYGHHHRDADAYHWLAFTAITVKLLDMITVSQQRAHESAQIRATSAPVGETIYWSEGNARGAVTAVRDGASSSGRYCREFQQTLTVGGRTENACGTACMQPDGSWEIIP